MSEPKGSAKDAGWQPNKAPSCTIERSDPAVEATLPRTLNGYAKGATTPSTASDESLARRSGVRMLLAEIEFHEAITARLRNILAKL
ncbi:MAG: hypothetical protein L0312_26740 [Acidobacteria bacterium]|nr:hypothetical protein [Acidobacteriota bacterium]